MNDIQDDLRPIQDTIDGKGPSPAAWWMHGYSGPIAADKIEVKDIQPIGEESVKMGDNAQTPQNVIRTARSMIGKNQDDDAEELTKKLGLKTDVFFWPQDGKPSNERYDDALGTHPQTVDTSPEAWCAALVNWALRTNGLPDTGSARSRSFANYGNPVDHIDRAQPGDIVVIYAGSIPDYSHTAIVLGRGRQPNTLKVISGNWGGMVQIHQIKVSLEDGDVIRRPLYKGVPKLPFEVTGNRLPTVEDIGNPFASGATVIETY